MSFYRRNWYYIGGILFVFLAYLTEFWRNDFSKLQIILIYSFMAMLVHQFEEYGVPGGFPSIFNIVCVREISTPDRYPLNANQVMINNVFMTYPFYILAIIFPNAIWYGLITIGQGMVQLTNHGFYNNIKLKSLYNPGLASVLLLHWPIGIYYIWYVTVNNLVTPIDYVIGFLGAFSTGIILWLGPVKILRNKQSKYPFTEKQMYGYAEQKIRQIENTKS